MKYKLEHKKQNSESTAAVDKALWWHMWLGFRSWNLYGDYIYTV